MVQHVPSSQALAHGNVAGFVAHEVRAGQIDAARHNHHHHHHPLQPGVVVVQQQPYYGQPQVVVQQAYASPAQVVVQYPTGDNLQQREFRQEAMAQRDLARGDVSTTTMGH